MHLYLFSRQVRTQFGGNCQACAKQPCYGRVRAKSLHKRRIRRRMLGEPQSRNSRNRSYVCKPPCRHNDRLYQTQRTLPASHNRTIEATVSAQFITNPKRQFQGPVSTEGRGKDGLSIAANQKMCGRSRKPALRVSWRGVGGGTLKNLSIYEHFQRKTHGARMKVIASASLRDTEFSLSVSLTPSLPLSPNSNLCAHPRRHRSACHIDSAALE